MWRVIPAVSAALLMVTVGAIAVFVVEGDRSVRAGHFGSAGEQWRVVSVVMDDRSARGLSAAVVEFAETHDASVAFASADASVVTLFDPSGRFASPGGNLYSRLEASGPAPAALVSTAVITRGPEGADLVPAGVRVLGTFEPEVVFDGRYPAIVQNVAASGFRSGVYLFAGLAGGDEAAINALFGDNGMQIVRFEAESELTPAQLFSTTLFGRAMVGFVLLSLLAAFLVLHGHAVLSRRWLMVAGRCGATTSDLRRLVLGRLAPPTVLGLLSGAVVVIGGVGALRGLMLTGALALLEAYAAALLCCVLGCALMILWVVWWEARRSAGALPR